MNRILTRIDLRDPVYLRSVEREGRFWKGNGGTDPVNPTELPIPLLRYRQERMAGDGHTDLYAYLRGLGPFRSALSIGCGSAIIEIELLKRGIIGHLTLVDISEESLDAAIRGVPKARRGDVTVLRQDLNAISLPHGHYDLIFCANVLHHIINLEHVLLELNASLSDNGIIFVDDFVGESRFQFSEGRLAMLRAVATIAHERTGVRTKGVTRTGRKSLINACPFEAVRSAELLDLIHQVFGKRTIRESTYGAVSSWMAQAIDMTDLHAHDAAEIFVVADRAIMAAGILPPLYVFGTYRKEPSPPRLRVKRWTRTEVKHHLPVRRFDEGLVLRIATRLQRVIGDGKLYGAMKRLYFRIRR